MTPDNACVSCGEDRGTGKRYCGRCRTSRVAHLIRLTDERLKHGRCPRCGEPALPGRKCCKACLVKCSVREQQRQRTLRDAGLCIRCKSPRGGSVSQWACVKCLVKYNERRYGVRA